MLLPRGTSHRDIRAGDNRALRDGHAFEAFWPRVQTETTEAAGWSQIHPAAFFIAASA